MKRRGDEVQFGSRGGAPRILTTQHNAAGPTIQYHIGPGVLKTNVSENPSLAGSQQPAVQYTCKFFVVFIKFSIRDANVSFPSLSLRHLQIRQRTIHRSKWRRQM